MILQSDYEAIFHIFNQPSLDSFKVLLSDFYTVDYNYYLMITFLHACLFVCYILYTVANK